jgi:hypothetical protein
MNFDISSRELTDMVSSQYWNAEVSNAPGRADGALIGERACGLLGEAMWAHGGRERFSRFRSARANFRIEGDIWSVHGGPRASVAGNFELGLREQSVRLHCKDPRTIESNFTPSVIAIDSADGGFVETQYNPRSSFAQGLDRPWDDFQLAYICSYSIWNVVTQPFLFAYEGFQSMELSPHVVDGERLRRLQIVYPAHVAAHAPTIVCHIGPDGTMRWQEFRFDLLNASVTSVLSDYADIQGVRLPTRRRMYRTSEIGAPHPTIFAELEIDKLAFY